jgi:PAS domain S-box-containing protein
LPAKSPRPDVRALDYRRVFDGLTEAVLILDPLDELRIIAANAAACTLYGVPHEQLAGSVLGTLAHGDALAGLQIRDLVATGRPRRFQVTHYRADGSELPVDVEASLIDYEGGKLVFCMHRTAAEATSAARHIMTAALEWQLTVDSMETVVLLTDLRGRVIRANRMALERSGAASFTELAGRDVESIGDRQEPFLHAGQLVQLAVAQQSPISSQVEDRGTGRTWHLSTIPAGSGDQGRVVIVARDVSDIIQMESVIRRSEKLASMGELVAGVAHEVRNPLFSISATLDALESRLATRDHATEQHLLNLHRAIQRLSALMQDLLEYGRLPQLDLVTVTLDDVVADAVAAVAGQAEAHGVTIGNRVTPEAGALLADRRRLAQAFQNILGNAIEHSPFGATIDVFAEHRDNEDTSWIACSIADQGPGFGTDDLGRVFEPFFTRRAGGTGLGLAIVERIAQIHGGRVTAANRPGGGAVVTVLLPCLGG